MYAVRLRYALAGLLKQRWQFQAASDRSVDSRADLRWGADGLGFRRILHPNGVCLTGTWSIDAAPPGRRYCGYFLPGSRGLVVGRYSVCCTETRRDRYRSLSLVGKLYPTIDQADPAPFRPASFITQEDLGGSRSYVIDEVELRNAPDVTPWNRRSALPVFLVTGLVLRRTDVQTTIRQLYEIAELGMPAGAPIATPMYMRLVADPAEHVDDRPDPDFRDEILGRIYDRGDPQPRRTLTFHIEVSDTGTHRGVLGCAATSRTGSASGASTSPRRPRRTTATSSSTIRIRRGAIIPTTPRRSCRGGAEGGCSDAQAADGPRPSKPQPAAAARFCLHVLRGSPHIRSGARMSPPICRTPGGSPTRRFWRITARGRTSRRFATRPSRWTSRRSDVDQGQSQPGAVFDRGERTPAPQRTRLLRHEAAEGEVRLSGRSS